MLNRLLFSLNNEHTFRNRWEFMTEGGDIKFGVYSKDSKGSTFDFVPPSRVDSHLGMEDGQITCEEPGKCKFQPYFFPHFAARIGQVGTHRRLLSIRCFGVWQYLQLFTSEKTALLYRRRSSQRIRGDWEQIAYFIHMKKDSDLFKI